MFRLNSLREQFARGGVLGSCVVTIRTPYQIRVKETSVIGMFDDSVRKIEHTTIIHGEINMEDDIILCPTRAKIICKSEGLASLFSNGIF